MSTRELTRLSIVEKVVEKRLKQVEGARMLKVSSKQMRRIMHRYLAEGAQGLVSKQRGKVSNRKHSDEFKEGVMRHVRSHYFDFGPRLATEKLLERHEIKVSDETVRKWMIEANLWHVKKQGKLVVHQQRERRSCVGELVQIDGSPHDWFEGRGPRCCLLVFIDDATSRLLALHFEPSETTEGYFRCVKKYVKRYGLPVAFYNDKHGIFRINMPNVIEEGETQFERAMRQIGIKIICANSAQAKGRVERANKTLQDRLIKEMRLRKISDIDTANAYLEEFMADHNKRFAVEALHAEDAHRKCELSDEMLDEILSYQDQRTLSKNLELSYKNVVYQIKTKGKGYTLRHAKVTVIEGLNGQVTLRYKGRKLEYTTYKKRKKTAEIICEKQINQKIDDLIKSISKGKRYKPSLEHPWRNGGVKSEKQTQAIVPSTW